MGELAAEADDRMLQAAFYESRNYRELIQGSTFRFVVGRRGTGKSALFQKVAEAFEQEQGTLLLKERPSEEKATAFHYELNKLTNQYAEARIVTRLTWKVQVLTQAVDAILGDYKSNKLVQHADLVAYRSRHATLFREDGLARSLTALREVMKDQRETDIRALPEQIANYFDVSSLQNQVLQALSDLHRKVVLLYDGLDEGWVPTPVATAVLGGLAKAAVDFKEGHRIHCLLFVRDNMFRALAEFDGDYTRNIEGSTLRLFWDEESLLSFVALRLRAAFDWKGENNIKAWSRFAQRGLEGIDGFRRCLRLTLYRPRDVIALINGAFQVACGHDRESLIDTDVEATAARISRTRFNDLCKEYEKVLPGLPRFAEVFQGRPAKTSYGEVQSLLAGVIDRVQHGPSARDFALLQTGAAAFNALYSVGFLGIQNEDRSVRFCHDGSNTDVENLAPSATVMVHPCYWLAMGIETGAAGGGDESDSVIVAGVDDEDDKSRSGKKDMIDMRLRQLGRIVEELHSIPEGNTGAHAFEGWVYSAARYLFATGLDNVQWKPNPGHLQQRDIVGTLKETGGFWRRIGRYDVQQFIIEVKNYGELDADAFRQAWGYLQGPYGRCLMIVTRSAEEGISERERALVKEGYDGDPHKLVLLMPAKLLQRALSKMRSGGERRDDYTADLLNKRMDVFERSYIAQRALRRSRK